MINRICPQCGTQFEPKSAVHKFCKKPCYFVFNGERYNRIAKERAIKRKENPSFPKYIDDNGVEHQMDFFPEKDHNKFLRFKANLKAPN